MPQYLAKDFVQQAVSKKQQLLSRMLLACPEHLEYVEAYPHQGRLTDSLFLTPWKHTTSEQDEGKSAVDLLPSVCEDDRFWPELHSLSALCVCLKELAELCPSVLVSELVFSDVADRPTAISSPELIGSFRSHDQSHDTMSLEIELAMEAEEGLSTRMEGLCTESLEVWIKEEEGANGVELLQEDMLGLDLCDLGVLHLPSLTALTQRLQPKPVQDPFTDHSGHKHRHTTVLASDLRFGPVSSCSKEWLNHREVFLREDLGCFGDEEEGEVLVMIAGSSRGVLLAEPLMSSPVETVDSLDLAKLDPFSDVDLEVEHELEGLCSAFPSKLSHCEPMVFREKEASQGMDANFALMNHASVALSDSVDSGCQHMFLESPSSGTGDPGEGGGYVAALSEEELALLEAIPTSPEVAVRKMRIIDCSEERRLTEELRSKEMLFDDILACLLPMPKCPEQLTEIPTPSCIAAMLCVRPVDKDTESEFSLLWDPLHDGHVAMEMAQMALRTDSHFSHQESSLYPTLLRVDQAVVFRQEALELQEEAEGYISLFGSEGCGQKTGYHPRPASSSNASIPSSFSQITTTTANPASTMSSHKTIAPLKQITSRDGRASEGVTVGGDTLRTNMSPLDFFVMMRKGSSQGSSQLGKSNGSEAGRPSLDRDGESEGGEGQRGLFDHEQHYSEGKRQSEEVVLTGAFLVAYELLEHQGQIALNTLQRMHLGQHLPARFGGVQVDMAAFLLRQQETQAAVAQGGITQERHEDVVFESCRWSATLLVLATVADCLLNSSFDSALNQLLVLTEQYSQYIGDSLSNVRADLGRVQIQLTSSRSCLHPKAEWLVAKMASWSATAEGEGRRRRREKALVLVAGDFTVISAEVMNALNGVSGLSTCVFALAPKHPGDMEYLQEVEARLQQYSCLVVSPLCIADCFPWERISQVVEYNTSTHSHTHIVRCHTHMEVCTLRGVVRRDVPVPAVNTWTQTANGGVQYKFICSQNVTSDVCLMQLLESRFNIVILERDYTCLATSSSSNNKGEGLTRALHYADVILDECSGILLHPLDQLASPDGFKAITTRVTTLSLQFEKLWILLYSSETGSYPYSGHVPVNISKIHASVANFSTEKDNLAVHVLVAGSVEDAACYVRKLGEKAHSTTKSWSHEDWSKRNWLVDELSAHEKFLLHFPCLTAFSSQLMLATCTLKNLLTSDCASLLQRLRWIPEKCLKMFHTLSRLSTSPFTHTLPAHLTTAAAAPARASHVPATNTSQDQSQLPSSGSLPSTHQSGQPWGGHSTKAAVVPTQGAVHTSLFSRQTLASGAPPIVDRLGVGGSHISTTSNVTGGHFQSESGGDQFKPALEQVQQQQPCPAVKQRQKKSFYRYTAPADAAITLQGGTGNQGTQLTVPLGVKGGSSAEQNKVVRSKFFTEGPSHTGPEAGVQRGLKKLLAYGRQKEEQQNTASSTCNLLEQAQIPSKTTPKIINHGSGSVDQVFPMIGASPSSATDSTWPSSSGMSQSRRGKKPVPSIPDTREGWQKELAGGSLAVGGGARWEGCVAMPLIETTPSGRKRQPVRCLSLDNEEEGMSCEPALGGHPAKKKPCPSMFATPMASEKTLVQDLPLASEGSSASRYEGGGSASEPLKPFDLQTFHSHQVTGGGAKAYPLARNTDNNHDLFSDNHPNGTLSAGTPSHTQLPSQRQSKWMQWMQGDGNEVAYDSHFSFNFHPRQSPLQVVPPHLSKDV